VAPDALAPAEVLRDIVPLPELLFDTIPVMVCVIVRISVRVPVAVTESEEVTVAGVFEGIDDTVCVGLAEVVLEVVEL